MNDEEYAAAFDEIEDDDYIEDEWPEDYVCEECGFVEGYCELCGYHGHDCPEDGLDSLGEVR